MKRQHTFWVLVLGAGLLAGACSDEDYTNDFTKPAGGTQITLSCQSQLDENNKVAWASDSKIGFFCEQTASTNLGVGLAAGSVEQNEGLFYTKVAWNKEVTDHTFYIYTPYNESNTSAQAIAGTLSNSQLQNGTTTAHLTDAALTYASVTAALTEEPVPVTFRHALGYLDLSLKTDAKYAGWKVKSVTFEVEDPATSLAGAYTFDLTTGQLTITGGFPAVTLKVDNAPELVAGTAFHAYLAVNPQDLQGKTCHLTAVIEKEGAESDLQLKSTLATAPNIAAGGFTTVEMAMDGSHEEEVGDESINLSANETANCYVAGQAGREYRFKATVMGNGATTPAGSDLTHAPGITPTPLAPTSAAILWQSSKSLLSGVKLKSKDGDQYVYFTLNGSADVALTPGNAVIAVYDDANTILWSWHIWVTDADLDAKVQTYAVHSDYSTFPALQNPMMMDRNLGATDNALWANETSAKNSHGLFYQWGRKDPVIGPGDANNTSLATVFGANNEEVSFDFSGTASITRDDIAKSPMLYTKGTANNWFAEDVYDLWGNSLKYDANGASSTGTKSIYDPCPPGYRVPHPYVWSGFTSNKSGGNYKNDPSIISFTMQENYTGVTFTNNGAAVVYPSTGFINAGNFQRLVYNSSAFIQFWSNAMHSNGTQGARFNFDQQQCVTPNGNGRNFAFCIRCMKDTESTTGN